LGEREAARATGSTVIVTTDSTPDTHAVFGTPAVGTAPDMFVVQPGAPAIDLFRPSLDDAALDALFAQKRAERELRIAEIVARAEREGRPSERIVAAIIHDSEQAPFSTNRAQLEAIGVQCPPPGCAGLSDAEVTEALWKAIYGLAFLGVFLSGTDHLSDRTLLNMLCTRIIEEQVRDVPPSRDMSEFIDLTPCRAADLDGPDGLGGPFDVATEDPGEDDDDPTGFGVKRRTHRDDFLPRPSRGPM
jgi:hypothetical protein